MKHQKNVFAFVILLACNLGVAFAEEAAPQKPSSTVGSFFSNVVVDGDVNQQTGGKENTQNLSVGSVEGSTVQNFNKKQQTTKTGAITQTISGGSNNQQDMAVGSVQGSNVKDYDAKITTGNLKQDIQSGNNSKQEMLIGSVKDSQNMKNATFNTDVTLQNVTQTSKEGNNKQSIQVGSAKNAEVTKSFDSKVVVTGDITQTAGKDQKKQDLVIGSVENSKVDNFKSDVTVKGKINQTSTGSGHSQSANFGSVR